MPPPPPAKQRKIAVVGSRAVGKSSLAVQYVDGHFVESYYPTIENTFVKTIKYKGQEYATEIVDTAGQDEYSDPNSKLYIGIHGYIIVYSVSSRSSFAMIEKIRDNILNHLGASHAPMIICGNKCDLRPQQRQVSEAEGRAWAEKHKCGWTETSARHNQNVSKAFESLIAEIEKDTNPGEPPATSKGCVVM